MASQILVYTRYNSGADFGGSLEVNRFSVRKPENQESSILIEFEGSGGIRSAYMYLEPKLAIPLARNLLSVAEGYVSESESEVG